MNDTSINIPQELLVAIITSIFTLLGVLISVNKQSKLSRITDERIKWRETIRAIAIELSKIDVEHLSKQGQADLTTILTELKIRINIYGRNRNNVMKDSHIWKCIDVLESPNLKNNTEKDKMVLFLSALLKYDWDRSKSETPINVFSIIGYCTYIISNVLFVYLTFADIQNVDIKIIIGFIIIFAIVFFFPCVCIYILNITFTYLIDAVVLFGIPVLIYVYTFVIFEDMPSWLFLSVILQSIAIIFLFISKFDMYKNIHIYTSQINRINKEYPGNCLGNKPKHRTFVENIKKKGEKLMKNKANKKQEYMLNLIHIIILLVITFAVFRAVVCIDTGLNNGAFWDALKEGIISASVNEWFTFIGAIAFILFGINGIYEYCYANGMRFLCPPLYQKAKDALLLKQAEKMMKLYYDRDLDFIKTYESEKMDKVLNLLQLTDKQFHHVRYEILKARAGSISDLSLLEEKTKTLLLNKEYIVNLTSVDSSERVYEDVKYYIDLYTALLDENVYEDAGRLMTNFLKMKMGNELEHIDCLIVPYGGNLLLGLSVAKKLGIRLISILKDGRILKMQPWDGEYPEKTNGEKNKVAILHDVLVSGERIYKSLESLPKDSYELLGLFSLVYYKTTKNPINALNNHGITTDKIHNIIEVSDDEMEAIING